MADLYKSKYLQNDAELNAFIALLKRENVTSYLEIGSKFGGTLWRIANSLPKGSRILSVDLPWGDRATEPHLLACVAELNKLGYRAHVTTDDSTNPEVVAAVSKHAPFDAIFIDANHTEPYVREDFKNYGQMGRIIAFHDIAWNHPTKPGRLPIDVPRVWDDIKRLYRHEEIRLDPGGRDNGIGVLFR
jgi:predicted O-methyltransferase YrrM